MIIKIKQIGDETLNPPLETQEWFGALRRHPEGEEGVVYAVRDKITKRWKDPYTLAPVFVEYPKRLRRK